MAELSDTKEGDPPAKWLRGQRKRRDLGIIEQFERKQTAYGEHQGENNAEIMPINEAVQEVERAIVDTAILDAYFKGRVTTMSLAFPPSLLSITVTKDSTSGNGQHTEDGDATADSEQTLSLSLNSSASGSASIMLDMQPRFRENVFEVAEAIDYVFFLPEPVTRAAILSRLGAELGATVNAWPNWQGNTLTFTITGQRVSVNATAEVHQSASNSAYSYGQGIGSNRDAGITQTTKQFPPCFHGAFTLILPETTKIAVAYARAGWEGNSGFPTRKQTSLVAGNAIANIQPRTVAASNPPTLPTSGRYLRSYNVEYHGTDETNTEYCIVQARVIDFAVINPA